ncbi:MULTISPECIES: RloB family protein [unclassified Pseudomonas]|uniref:RloB family protein n=1 Tax=unclassified Pseudomonas TaxID=196821 RepID=UPI00129EDC50|nr:MULTISPECIES: RloB family protein [unclassified Pseudomonas]MDH4653467.1 RloB domain-containing protein [Pseudomonas sp. BN606]MRK22389.1 RloB domain-containing protein [Pseudomonas sp. JG-B]
MPKPRPKNTKPVPRKMHVYCEGEKTEPNYIQAYINSQTDKKLRSVIRIEDTTKNTPVQLVEEAIKDKESGKNPSGDSYWVVYDRESVNKYPDALHDQAYIRAKKHEINIALSNVCFEYWLLLHFQNSNAPYSCFNDLIAKSALKAHVRRETGKDYEKGSRDIYHIVKGDVAEARARAIAINAQTLAAAAPGITKPHQLNPYTDMPALLEAIDNFTG